jgi:transposase
MEDVREELKKSLSVLGPRGRGKPYPKGLLDKLVSYTVARRRQGATLVEIGAEVGISWKTLGRWLSGGKGKPRFHEVAIVTPRAVAPAIIVHGPRGLRIEGLDLGGVAELVRRLGE